MNNKKYRFRKRKLDKGPIVLIAILSIVLVIAIVSANKGLGLQGDASLGTGIDGQLNEKIGGTTLYDLLYEGMSKHNTSIVVAKAYVVNNEDYANETFQSVLVDHPELFWPDGTGSWSGFSGNITSNFILSVGTRCEMENVPQMEERLNFVVDTIVNNANLQYESDYDKAKYVHDLIVQDCEYDFDTYSSHTNDVTSHGSMAYSAYGCLVEHKAVCEGYAKAYQLIMNKLGIECGYITGMANNGETTDYHAWNYIKLVDGYYMVDVTWDDPIGNSSNNIAHDYFCISTKTISSDHTIDKERMVPLCDGRKYASRF